MRPLSLSPRLEVGWLAVGRVFAGTAVAAVALISACATGGDGSASNTTTPPVTNGNPDAGTFVFPEEAGSDAAPSPLLSPCTPGSPAACTTGFVCYAQHTSASWWVDLYGTCTFNCDDQTLPLCESFDGVCGCPVDANGNPENCGSDGGVSMVCVPAVKPGTSPGANEGDGGCGSPGCGGGAPVGEAGAAPIVDAGTG